MSVPFARTLPLPRVLLAQPAPDVPAAKPAAHPLQVQLCARLVDAGGELIRGFVEELDAALQSLLAESRNAVETRAVLDLGSALSMNRPALLRGFVTALERRFDPLRQLGRGGIFDLERLCLLPAEEMEENLVLAHLAQQAEQRAGEDGRQLVARLQWAARDLSLPALADALGPTAFPECFAQAFRLAGLATSERVLAYRLVESHGLKSWPALVRSALQVLDQQGLRRARSLAGDTAVAAAEPAVSPATLRTLREARASVVSGADGGLAIALLRAIEPPFGGSDAGVITVLVGGWLDALLAEPELPPAIAPDLEALRLPAIKAALCDPSFFAHPFHPVRKAMDEVVQKAAFTGLQGYSLGPVRSELKEIAARISIQGRFAADALQMLGPLAGDLAVQFRQQLAKEQEARRESLLLRVRTLVTRELEARTLDVSLPAAARAALTRGFLPLLSTLMLRHGAASPPSRQARQLLERFVDSFALCSGSTERQAVLQAFCDSLVDAGLSSPHMSGVCAELETAYAELEEEARASAAAGEDGPDAQREIDAVLSRVASPSSPLPVVSPEDAADDFVLTPITASNDLRTVASTANPLRCLLKPGHWFRVRDYKRGDDRWLSLVGVHPEMNRVSFSGFDGATVLAMRATQFVEDLASGLAEPLNPDAEIQQALQFLRARPTEALERLQQLA